MSAKNPTKQEKFHASTGKKPKKPKAKAMNEMKSVMMEKMKGKC